jgi:uncharacterized membrane protein
VLKNVPASGLETDVNVIGAGRENLLSAVNAAAALDPVSTSFGAVPAGSGQTRTSTVTVTNLTGGASIFAVSVGAATGTGVAFSVSPASVALAAGASATVTITATSAKGASAGDHFASLRVRASGAEVAHAVVYALVK